MCLSIFTWPPSNFRRQQPSRFDENQNSARLKFMANLRVLSYLRQSPLAEDNLSAMVLRLFVSLLCLSLLASGFELRLRTDSDIVDLMRLMSKESTDYKMLKALKEDDSMKRSDRQGKLSEILLRQSKETQDMFDMKMAYEDAVEAMHQQEMERRMATASPNDQQMFEDMRKLKNDMSLTVAEFKDQRKQLKRKYTKSMKMQKTKSSSSEED
ncbi:hypothetical protein QR680_013990 [Steinernema hermaphroditum]|uniref:Uncharacterized protein n=1 Tax=Steinernema hermaphroditum TaxID=289476 RepID=A0AA39I7C7_9BILA|nr:hypothetical protein QR680_013990 [Steinernema hermaphroditum]